VEGFDLASTREQPFTILLFNLMQASLGRPKRRWEGNGKMDVREVWGGMNSFDMAQYVYQ
jgi:hypothetical protein